MKKYRFGFSPMGFFSFLLVMLPNIIWMINPPVNNPVAGNTASNPMIEIVQNVSQYSMIALLTILIHKENKRDRMNKVLLGVILFCLLGYYALWITYYTGIIYPWVLVGLAVLPSLYFLLICIKLKNTVAIIPSIIFGITHVGITCSNFLS
ncbi:MAG: hypothetical protein K0S47_2141 [Herbinix sp.]|jgi:hypothetical protein|nr:hypothetical protein [Herbinix sp.]